MWATWMKGVNCRAMDGTSIYGGDHLVMCMDVQLPDRYMIEKEKRGVPIAAQ